LSSLTSRATTRSAPQRELGVVDLDSQAGLALIKFPTIADLLTKSGWLRRTTPEELVVAAGGYTGKGSRLARRAASYVRSGVDSQQSQGCEC
jgi:hypothetical protein